MIIHRAQYMGKNNLWAWYSKEIQAEEHSITLTFAEWVGIHGALRIARENHRMARHPRAIATEMIERIEELFGEAGMTQTELDQLYWAESSCVRHATAERRKIYRGAPNMGRCNQSPNNSR